MKRAIYNMAKRIIDNDVDGPYVVIDISHYRELCKDHHDYIQLIGDSRHEKYRLERIIEDQKTIIKNKDDDYRKLQNVHKDGILPQMLDIQKELYDLNGMPNVDFSRPLGLRAQRVITEGIGDFTKSAIHECVELENWTQWKPWSRQLGNKSTIERWSPEHLKEIRLEVIDLLAFVFNLCCLLGIDYKMLWKMYHEKMRINIHERHQSGVY